MPYPLILFLKKVVMVFFRQSASILKEMNPLFHQTCFNVSLHGNIKDFFTGIPRARIGDVQWESLATRRFHPSTTFIGFSGKERLTMSPASFRLVPLRQPLKKIGRAHV